MQDVQKKAIISLVDFVKIDRFYVSCHFKCHERDKTVVSTVPFEPYDGKIELTWKDMLLHPIKSYNIYYHTPITIYGNKCHETIVLKAFKNVENNFIWNQEKEKYIHY